MKHLTDESDFITQSIPDPDDWQWEKEKKHRKKPHSAAKRKAGTGCGCLVSLVIVAVLAIVVGVPGTVFFSGKSLDTINSNVVKEYATDNATSTGLYGAILEGAFQQHEDISDVSVYFDEEHNIYVVDLVVQNLTLKTWKSRILEHAKNWNETSTDIATLSALLQENALELDVNAAIQINVLNDWNEDRVLLSVVNGVTVYNFME